MELTDFVRESNRIEGILREPSDAEVEKFAEFLALDTVSVADVEGFVAVYQTDAELRRATYMNVYVGNHVPPKGGPHIVKELVQILARANSNREHPFQVHQDYETLHPFSDGNGRSGRALWAWQMRKFDYWPGLQIGFLHCWYYQSLSNARTQPEGK